MERGTLVKIKGPDTLNLKSLGRSFYVADGGHTSLSASGVLLVPSKGVVITSGTLIAPFLETLSAPPAPPKLSRGTTLEVLLDSHYTHSRNATDEVASGVKWIPAKLLELVFCEDVKYALDRLVDGREWVVGWPRQTDQIGSQDLARVDQLANQYWKGIEAFAILQLAEIPSSLYDEPPLPLSQQSLIRGLPLSLVGSPFGILSPVLFRNSVYRAMVSNIVSAPRRNSHSHGGSLSSLGGTSEGPPPSVGHLLMLDQACFPGCEGGPCLDIDGKLYGILVPPIREAGSQLEVHLAIPVASFQYPLLQALIKLKFISPDSEYRTIPQLAASPSSSAEALIGRAPWLQCLESVVVVSVGSYWASGVIISSSHVITSAHLFRPLLDSTSTPLKPVLRSGNRIDVRLDAYAQEGEHGNQPHSRLLSAKLVFVSDSHLDVALIQLNLGGFSSLDLKLKPLVLPQSNQSFVSKGDIIYGIGYALFGPSRKLKVTCTEGIVSGITSVNKVPQIIQTSAIINKGASGGAIVDSNGRFVGLVTCNAITKEGAVIPRINFCIPSQMLRPIARYVLTSNTSYLEQILKKDTRMTALWKLSEPPPTPLLPPSLLEKQREVIAKVSKSTVGKPKSGHMKPKL